jgi:hypothetical protein
MKNILVILSFYLFSSISYSQTTLKIENDYWSGIAIYQNGNKISVNEAKEIAKNNLAVVKKLSSAKTNRTIGLLIGFPGSFAFGYTLGSSFNKTVKANWTVGGIGAAMMIGGLILEGKGNKQLKEAVDEYNQSITKTTASFNPEFSVNATENGVGIAMRF